MSRVTASLAAALQPQGCFNDYVSPHDPINALSIDDSGMTIEKCQSLCTSSGYTFAATQVSWGQGYSVKLVRYRSRLRLLYVRVDWVKVFLSVLILYQKLRGVCAHRMEQTVTVATRLAPFILPQQPARFHVAITRSSSVEAGTRTASLQRVVTMVTGGSMPHPAP